MSSERTEGGGENAVLLRVREVAVALGISETLTRKLIDRGDLPSVKIGEKAVRVSRRQLAMYVEELERLDEVPGGGAS